MYDLAAASSPLLLIIPLKWTDHSFVCLLHPFHVVHHPHCCDMIDLGCSVLIAGIPAIWERIDCLRMHWLQAHLHKLYTPTDRLRWKQSVIDLSQKHSPFHERTVSCGTTCSPIVIRRSTAPSRQKGRDMLILAQGSNHSVNSFGHSYLNPFGQPAFPQMSGVWGWKSTKLIKCLLHSCFSLWMEYKRRKQH